MASSIAARQRAVISKGKRARNLEARSVVSTLLTSACPTTERFDGLKETAAEFGVAPETLKKYHGKRILVELTANWGVPCTSDVQKSTEDQ